MLEAIDVEADPCEDFFQFACGTWNRTHIIPDDRPNYNTFRKLGDELHVTLKSETHPPPHPPNGLSKSALCQHGAEGHRQREHEAWHNICCQCVTFFHF